MLIVILVPAVLALHPDYDQVCIENAIDRCGGLFNTWDATARAYNSQFYCEDGESMGWVAGPYLRGYIEAYKATGDTYWLTRFVGAFNGAICRTDSDPDNDCTTCYFTQETYDAQYAPEWGWYEVSDWYSIDSQTRFDFIVGEGLTLRAVAGFIKEVYDDPVLQTEFKVDADYYLDLAEDYLISKWDRRNLFLPADTGSVYLFQNHTGQRRESVSLPHNQMQELAKALIIFYEITGNTEYRYKVEQMLQFFKSKWYDSNGYIEWHYWDPAGPWDYTNGEPEHRVNVDHKGGYSAIVADTVIKAYLAGIEITEQEANDFLSAIQYKADTKSGWYVPVSFGVLDTQVLIDTRDSLLADPGGWGARTEGIPTFMAIMNSNSNDFYVDPDFSGGDGSASSPWSTLGSTQWTVINNALALGDVTVYVSAREASSDTPEQMANGITVQRTDTTTNRLTIDGMSKYNTNDQNPNWAIYNGNHVCKLTDNGGHAIGWNHVKLDYITLRGFEVSGRQGRVTFGGDHLVIEHIHSHDIIDIGPSFHLFYAFDTSCNDGPGVFTDIIIRNNTIERSRGEAIYLGGTQNWNNGCTQDSHTNIKIYGNTIIDAGTDGGEGDAIDVKDGLKNVEIFDNTIITPRQSGIHIYGVYSGDANIQVHDNHITGAYGRGIMITSGSSVGRYSRGIQVFNNIVQDCQSIGISLTGDDQYIEDIQIEHNTVYGNENGINIGGSNNIQLRNNLVFGNSVDQLSSWGSNNINSDYNAYQTGDTWGFGSEGGNTVHAASLVVNPGNDFTPIEDSVLCDNGQNNADIGAIPCDGCDAMTITELNSIINQWKSGTTSMQVLMGAITVWKNGC